MLNTLFVCYNRDLSNHVKEKFAEDFVSADKILLCIVLVFSVIVAFGTSWQHGQFKLGMIGGALISTVTLITYLMMAGSAMSRIIMATALVALLAITVQQSNGLGEGHFLFFLGFTILIRYRDFTPLLLFVGLTVVHHLTLTYCQSIGAEFLGRSILVFSWGAETEWGLLSPLAYHVSFALTAMAISSYYIYDGNMRFVESNAVLGTIEEAASGDLSIRVDSHIRTTMADKIDAFLVQLGDVFKQLEKITSSVISHSSETKQSSSKRAENSRNQQDQVLLVASAVTEMAAAAQEISRNAEQTAAAAGISVGISETGAATANTCRESVISLAEQVKSASDIVAELDVNSQQISTIVATISSIAEQTNLLALNAAIEAARAGEQGRGFAVVADEVRVLSQRTHSSTVEISAMIDSFQKTLKSAVGTMDGCHQFAETTVENSSATVQCFTDISDGIRGISASTDQIATAAEQQTSVTNEIDNNTNQIQVSSEDFYQEAQESAQHALELETQALTLNKLLEQFQH